MNKKKITIYLISVLGIGGILFYFAKRSKSEEENQTSEFE